LYDEFIKKYGNSNHWKYFTDVFDYLNIAAVVENEIFCVHGGISLDIKTFDQIRVINRLVETPHEGPLADLIWSNPDEDIKMWGVNHRGVGLAFGSKIAAEFNSVNG
jgi:diadenosine tetraphosphatase ApaH/serine/threonine PP2A family protein phosphatase